jgi:hypothetical protein
MNPHRALGYCPRMLSSTNCCRSCASAALDVRASVVLDVRASAVLDVRASAVLGVRIIS